MELHKALLKTWLAPDSCGPSHGIRKFASSFTDWLLINFAALRDKLISKAHI